MERLISDEERIRRAEDILERRKSADLRISSESFVKEKTNSKVRKMLFQILISLMIYCGVFFIKNSKQNKYNYIFENINNILNYDIDFKEVYYWINEKYNMINSKIVKQEEHVDNKNIENNNNIENNEEKIDDNQEYVENNSLNSDIGQNSEILGIGGAIEEEHNDNNIIVESFEEDNDIKYIKNNYDIIKPLKNYIVTSKFGTRASSDIVSANHKGIDLGAATGTDVVSSLNGTVIEASSTGDFGIHLKIQTDDIIIIYAHCSKLLVKQGEQVAQGQKIAEVGSTGKATGPHLHYEIRRNDKSINPEEILEF